MILPPRDTWSVIDDPYKAVTACHIYDPSESDTRPATIDSRQIHQYEITIRASNIDKLSRLHLIKYILIFILLICKRNNYY